MILKSAPKALTALNKQWSQSFKTWLSSADSQNILKPQNYLDAEFDSWEAGGCRVLGEVLAQELTIFYFQYHFSLEMLLDGETPTHIVVVTRETTDLGGELMIDAQGIRTREQVIKEFVDSNDGSAGRPLSFARYDSELCDEWGIQTTPWKFNALAREFKKFLATLMKNGQ